MAPSHFLFQEHLGDLFRRELRLRNRWVPALDQGSFTRCPPPASSPLSRTMLGRGEKSQSPRL
jgi:hypothetical protein